MKKYIRANSEVDELRQYIKDQLIKVQKTVNSTDSSADSYNMGWLEGQLRLLKDLNNKFIQE